MSALQSDILTERERETGKGSEHSHKFIITPLYLVIALIVAHL